MAMETTTFDDVVPEKLTVDRAKKQLHCTRVGVHQLHDRPGRQLKSKNSVELHGSSTRFVSRSLKF